MGALITLKEYFGKHAEDPLYKYELDDTKFNNAVILISKINRLEEKLNQFKYEVTSGWRPKAYNAQIGGAKFSNHVICRAIDIKDVDNLLGNYLKENVKVLADIGLCIENPESTPGWLHIQDVMPHSGRRVFNP
jgi:hypothetical protein